MRHRHVPPTPAQVTWGGAVEVEVREEWSRAWRARRVDLDACPSPRLRLHAGMPSGVRLAFTTDSTSLELHLAHPTGGRWTEPMPIDVLAGGELVASAPLGDGVIEVSLGRPMGEVEVWLPAFEEVAVRGIRVDQAAGISPTPETRRRLVTYGSSITQCRTARSASQTWPAQVARSLDLDLVCLGYGAECHLDPPIAATIRSLAPSLLTLCVGINIAMQGSYSARTLPGAVVAFAEAALDGIEDVEVVLMSPIVSPAHESSPGPSGLSLRDVRAIVEECASALRDRGRAITYLDGLDVLGEEDAQLLHDGVHPAADGYDLMAARVTRVLRDLL